MTESLTAIVEYQIRPGTCSLEEWLGVWQQRGEDARTGEPETSAYAALVNEENPLNVLVFERYDHGRSSLDKHIQRPAHAALMDTMGKRNMTKRRVMSAQFADLPNYGWWSRPTLPGSPKDVILVLLGLRFADDAARGAFIRLTAEHASYCHDAEPDTLIYSGGLALADADRELDLKKGDLVFAMACTDMAAVEKHRDDPQHLALGPKFAKQGAAPQSTFRRTYRSTGNGFMWRKPG